MHGPSLTIAHLVIGGDIAGGQVVALQLARGAREHGHTVLFVSPSDGPFVELARSEDFEVHVLPIRSSLDVPALVRLRGLLRRNGVDVLHTHVMIELNVVGRIAARLARIAVVSHMHIENFLPQNRIRRRVVRLLDNVTARLATAILAVSEDTKRALERQGYPRGRIVVVHNGVSLPSDPSNGDGAGVVEVARLAPVKGQRELIEAVATLDDSVRLTLVGRDIEYGGEYERELRALVDRLGLGDRVEFAGHRADAAELMGQAALVVLPSWTEGLPLTLLEAMARRRAVVATPVGGTPEVVADGETGVLVPARDPKALARAIGALLNDTERRRRLGNAGRARVERKFSETAMIERVLEVYDAVA